MEKIVEFATNGRLVFSVLVAMSVIATIWSIGATFLQGDTLAKRMKSVANERERIRARERAAAKADGGGLRQQPKQYMKNVVDRFSLST